MLFTLHYRGELKANANPTEKHALRQCFHKQLAHYWHQPPLSDFQTLLAPLGPANELSVIRVVRNFAFAPLVCEHLQLVAELDIVVLWPQQPGFIIASGGDIDNRLKSLLDALKVPSEPNALPPHVAPQDGEDPFFCLLEDDSLVTRLNVQTDRLLELVRTPAEVELYLRVTTRQLRTMMGTLGLG